MTEQRYEYNYKIAAILYLIVCFSGLSYFFAYMAINGKEGLTLMSVIKLSPEQAITFYWLLCAFFICCSVLSIVLLLYRLITGKQYLTITNDGFTVPKTLFKGELEMRFTDIQQIREQRFKGVTTYTIMTSTQKAVIALRSFKNFSEFYETKKTIIERANSAQMTKLARSALFD